MRPLLLRITIAALLSVSSLLVILFRVSPLTAPGIALPFFFLTVALSTASVATLLFYAFWASVSLEGLDAGRKITIALREGIFAACAVTLIFGFLMLGILTWWIGVLIAMVFVLIELALHS
jgi:hypothetical protein